MRKQRLWAPPTAEESAGKPGNLIVPTGNTANDLDRAGDPVGMHLHEMGSGELLAREAEIALAKRIEAGREKMIGAIWESPLTVRAIIAWRDRLLEQKVLIRDIIDLNATYGGTPGDYHSAPDGEGDKAEPAEAFRWIGKRSN